MNVICKNVNVKAEDIVLDYYNTIYYSILLQHYNTVLW